MFNKIKFLLFLLILISFSCEKNLEENNSSTEITYPYEFFFDHNGVNRLYTLYKPDNLKEKAPLVFVLHGYTSNSTNIMNYSKMNEIADQNGFMVCYPQGTTNIYTGQTHWNANLKEMSSVTDSEFLTDLAKKLQAEFNLSEKNTFACGMSNGGFMSYTLGCERSDTFKAVASITGTMSGYDWNNCNPNKVPVLQISGTNDMVVPMDGSMSLAGGWGGAPKIQDIMNYWGGINECTQTQTQNLPDTNKTDNSYVSIEKKVDCFNNHQVWFYTVYGGAHTWPGAWGNMDINASEEIWGFFNRYIE
jgi:polyhydroxybutyrate depolymerase